jgi:hypothetical protein
MKSSECVWFEREVSKQTIITMSNIKRIAEIDYRDSFLPPEAGNQDAVPFEPNFEWLKTARPDDQKAVMWRWFTERYENPGDELPWDNEEGDYVYLNGPPVSPNDEIQQHFSDVVPYAVMADVIADLRSEVGDSWSPIDYLIYDDFDWYSIDKIVVTTRDDPLRLLIVRLNQIESTLEVDAPTADVAEILHQMAHGSIIAALEAYLADTVKYWVNIDEGALRQFVATYPAFKSTPTKLSEVFTHFDEIKKTVNKELGTFMWHRLDMVKQMVKSTFGFDLPDIGPLVKAVMVRHDIVHRAGRDVDGNIVQLSVSDIRALRAACENFAAAIDASLDVKYPRADKTVPWNAEF